MSLADLLNHLPSAKKCGGGWSARCPAHDDQKNSLSLTEAEDGKVLLKCHAGCATETILKRLGLGWSVMFPVSRPVERGNGKIVLPERDPLTWWAGYCGVPADSVKSLPLAADGENLVFTFGTGQIGKVRLSGTKDFRWSPPGAASPPLWPVPDGSLPEEIWLFEGESDCTVARFIGIDGYALTKGAGTPLTSEHAAALAVRGAKKVVLCLDADAAGEKGTERLAEPLRGGGLAVGRADLLRAGVVDPLVGTKDLRDAWLANPNADELRVRLGSAVLWTQDSPLVAEPLRAVVPKLRDVRSWPDSLDPAAFYGLAGDVVRTIVPHTEADPVALLVNFLLAFGNAVGRAPHAAAEADKHTLNLFAVLVGETAKGRKGTSWGHIRELFACADPTWGGNCVVGGLSSGEGLIWSVRDPIEKQEPVKEGRKTTGEYRSVLLDPGVEDKRLLVLEGEFASALKVMAREGNTLSAVIRLAWDTGDLRVLTKNNPAKATGAHISILGHITKDELLRYMSDIEAGNGFANRFLWFCTRRAQELPDGGGVPDYGELVFRLHRALDVARAAGKLVRDEEAGKSWRAAYHDLSEGKLGLFGSVTARAEAQVLRLSALYAALDSSPVIRAPHLMAALALWEYSEESARYIFGDATGDAVADRILTTLRHSEEGMSRTQLHELLGRNVSVGRIDQALGRLLNANLATCSQHNTNGRPKEVWTAA